MLIDPKTLIFSLTSTTATLITATENGCTGDVTAKNLEETPFNTSQKLTRKEDGTWHLEVDIQDSRMLDGWVAMWKNDAQITLSQKEYLERETDEDGE